MREVDGAPGWDLLRAAHCACPPAEYAEAERAYYAGAEAWCVALRASLALGRLPVDDAAAAFVAFDVYPRRNEYDSRAWWWLEGYADAEWCWSHALRRTGGDRAEVDRE
jgi:hypothetical protein